MSIKAILAATAAFSLASGAAFAGDYAKSEKTMEKADIVDTAVAAGSFSTLVAAVQAAGLEETLRTAEAITVFAPTDEAFAALPAGTVENLLKPENKDQLVSILTFHVLEGKTKSKALAGKTLSVDTLQGGALDINGVDGVTVNGVDVIKADVYASNGVIHVVDEVLLP